MGLLSIRTLLGVVGALMGAMLLVPPGSTVVDRYWSNFFPPAMIMKILDLQGGAERYVATRASIQLGIFDLLENEAQTVPQIAAKVQASDRGIKVLLEYLLTIHLVWSDCSAEECIYGLTASAKTHLVSSGTTDDLTGLFMLSSDSALEKLGGAREAIVRGGADPKDSNDGISLKKGSNENIFWESFAKHTVGMSLGPAAKLAAYAATLFEKNAEISVLDIAAGSGIYGAEVARIMPNSKIYALDQANVIPHTKKYIEDSGLSDRYEFLSGSAFDMTLPERAFDLIVVSHFIHHFDAETSSFLIGRFANALSDSGFIIFQEFIIPDAPTYSVFQHNPQPTRFAFSMLMSTEKGRVYSVPDFDQLFLASNLTRTGVLALTPGPSTLIAASRSA